VAAGSTFVAFHLTIVIIIHFNIHIRIMIVIISTASLYSSPLPFQHRFHPEASMAGWVILSLKDAARL
jgi:hypothetical protein